MTGAPDRLAAALADRYRIERELVQGGMATVYLAEDLKHRRKVAVKVLRPELAEALGAERFLREIETTANLRHPHILPLYDSGEAGGFLFYVMPLVEGESLRARIEREKQLPVDDALRIAREVADALSYAHSRGVIHRDIKPENVLLESGHAVVADFGIARAISSAGGETLTQTGLSVGTPQYMSPEQAAGEKDLDGRSDLYSLGCVLYEMLAGQPPFTGPTVASVVHQHVMVAAPPISNFRPAVPASVVAALQRALAKAPADRFNPVAQFGEAIQPGAAAPSAPAARAARPPRRAGRLALVVGAGLVVAAVAFAVLWLRRGGPRAPDVSSVAVLPFLDLSPDRSGEYLGDGISETLINALANVPGLSVAARTSAFSFRGRSVDVREIGRQLGVATVLEGSVQRAGDRLRVTAQLIKTSDGLHLWSQSFDRGTGDIFAVQDEVARAVVAALKGRLLAGASVMRAATGTRDLDAYDLFLQGRFFWNRRTVDDIERSVGFFEQAIARDSGYAQAWAGLGGAYLILPFYADVRTAVLLPKARAAVERAVALDPGLGDAQAALAYLLMLQDWNWSASDSAFQRAIATSPGNATAYKWYGDLLSVTGRKTESIRAITRAQELDPLSPLVAANLGAEYWNVGRDGEAMTWLEKSLAMDPMQSLALHYMAEIAFDRLDTARFFDAQARLDLVSTRAGAPVAELRRAFARGGRDAVARLEIASLKDLPYERAQWRARLGDADGVFRDLDQAFAERPVWLPFVVDERELAPMRSDPRYAALLRRMGLPEGPR